MIIDEDLTNEEMEELVQMIMVLDGQDRYVEVLNIWLKYIQMVFNEDRTKYKQLFNITNSLEEHTERLKARTKQTDHEERNMRDAGEILAMNFIRPIVSRAFDFSTYSSAKRYSYIHNALQVEIDAVEAKVSPLRHILEEFRAEGDNNESGN